jgi:RNA polymerase sigma-70 factor (ECF subfamily)
MGELNFFNEEDFTRCYVEYADDVRRFVFRHIRDEFSSEDIVQDVFMRLFERKEPLEPGCATIRCFLFTVAKNRMLDHLRRQRVAEHKLRRLVLEEALINEKFYADIENACIEGEVLSTLHDTIDSLPEIKREVFLKRAFLRMKQGEVMKEMSLSAFVVKKIEREVRQIIRSRLSRYVG